MQENYKLLFENKIGCVANLLHFNDAHREILRIASWISLNDMMLTQQKELTEIVISKSPFYLGGIAQGAETLIALVIMCIIPAWFMELAIFFGIICLVKAFSIIATAYYNFVIAERK